LTVVVGVKVTHCGEVMLIYCVNCVDITCWNQCHCQCFVSTDFRLCILKTMAWLCFTMILDISMNLKILFVYALSYWVLCWLCSCLNKAAR